MSKIIEFPHALQSTKPDARQVGGRPVYSIADLGEGAFDATAPQDLGASLPRSLDTPLVKALSRPTADWSNQELASLYRAHRLLNLTGIAFDVDRGLTDESDPWFVFLDEADHVFAHFCRIDGMYYLDSAAQGGCIVASSLEALVESFARRNEVLKDSTAGSNTSSQVVEFNVPLRTKVLMHPGVSLAALVWSVYVLSDGLVLPLWKQSDDGESLDTADTQPTSLEQSFLGPELSLAADLAEKEESSVYTSDLHQTADPRESQGGNHNSVFGPGGIYALNIFGFGLTAMSVSYGIYHFVLPTSLLPPVQKIFQTTLVTEHGDGLDETLGDMVGFLESFAGAVKMLNTQIRDTAEPTDLVSSLTDELLEGLKSVILSLQEMPRVLDLTELELAKVVVPTPVKTKATYVPVDTKPVVDVSTENVENSRYVALSDQDFFQKIFDFDVIDLSSLDVLSNISFAEDRSLIGALQIEEKGDEAVSPAVEDFSLAKSYALFDAAAHDFIIYLMMKDDVPQRSSYNDEIILIDMTAVDGSAGDVYARSWLFEDGSILSTVGLKADFEAFGLLV